MIVCADDYGLRQDIDEAILELCKVGKLSAISCMVAFQRCDPHLLDLLRRHEASVDVGLHLCLTNEGLPLELAFECTLPTFKQLFLDALRKRVDKGAIRHLISAQYDLFVAKSGRVPSHIDGHLHAHQLPGVREVLVEFLLNLTIERKPYVRNTWMPGRTIREQKLPWIKARMIGAFGLRMQTLLKRNGLPTNDGFAGIYDFKDWRHYPEYLPKFLECLDQPNGMMVVHPGLDEAWRRQEFETLKKFDMEKSLNCFQG